MHSIKSDWTIEWKAIIKVLHWIFRIFSSSHEFSVDCVFCSNIKSQRRLSNSLNRKKCIECRRSFYSTTSVFIYVFFFSSLENSLLQWVLKWTDVKTNSIIFFCHEWKCTKIYWNVYSYKIWYFGDEGLRVSWLFKHSKAEKDEMSECCSSDFLGGKRILALHVL